MALADALLVDPKRWGLMGIEFAFFHQFFNDDLRRELGDMRRVLYGQRQPPLPKPLLEAERFFAPVMPSVRDILEWIDPNDAPVDRDPLAALFAALPLQLSHSVEVIRILVDRLQKAGLFHGGETIGGGETIDLHPGLLTLLLPMLPDRVPTAREFWAIARRMSQLEEDLAAAPGSIELALVCGTPPVPDNFKALISYESDPATATVRLRVYSAKARDIRPAYSMVVGTFVPGTASRAGTKVQWRWRSGFPPLLEMSVSTTDGLLPTPGSVQEAFRAARRGMRFYDSLTKIKDYRQELETWGKATLCLASGMGNRDALELWTRRHPDAVAPYSRNRSAKGVTSSAEVMFSDQLKRVRKRVDLLRAMTTSADPAA